jgi:hypothetical protein
MTRQAFRRAYCEYDGCIRVAERPAKTWQVFSGTGVPAMDHFVKHYKGKTTSEGHKLEVKEKSNVIMIGFKHPGEYEDEYDPYIKVARIEKVGDGYNAGWFYDDGDEPSDSSEFTREEDLIAALDKVIEQRSAEVGRAGS